jgi:hypothetical protein
VSTVAIRLEASTVAIRLEVSTAAIRLVVSTVASRLEVSIVAIRLEVSTVAIGLEVSTVAIRLEVSTVVTSALSPLYMFFLLPTQGRIRSFALQGLRISCFACYVAGPLDGTTCDNGKLLEQVLMIRHYYLALSQASVGVCCI